MHNIQELKRQRIPLSAPIVSKQAKTYLAATLAENWLSPAGPWVSRFEDAFAKHLGTHAAAVVSGTAALHLALTVSGVQTDTAVITTPLTFIATANAIRYTGAEPIFVDVDPGTLGISAESVESYIQRHCRWDNSILEDRQSGRRIVAILPVHVLGNSCAMHDLLAVADKYGLPVIEDAAEAVGSCYDGRAVGTWGKVGCFSFNGNKTLSAGSGGMVVSEDVTLIERVRHLSTQAKSDALRYVHDAVGFNYRMSSLHAALALGQLEELPGIIRRKREINSSLSAAVAAMPGLELFHESPLCRSNHWLNLLLVPLGYRDIALEIMRRNAIDARPFWQPLHLQQVYACSPHDSLENTEALHARGLCLPGHPGITAADLECIVGALSELHREIRRSNGKQCSAG